MSTSLVASVSSAVASSVFCVSASSARWAGVAVLSLAGVSMADPLVAAVLRPRPRARSPRARCCSRTRACREHAFGTSGNQRDVLRGPTERVASDPPQERLVHAGSRRRRGLRLACEQRGPEGHGPFDDLPPREAGVGGGGGGAP